MFGRISLLIRALVVLTGHEPINSQTTGNFNGFDLVDKTGNTVRKPTDFRDLYAEIEQGGLRTLESTQSYKGSGPPPMMTSQITETANERWL